MREKILLVSVFLVALAWRIIAVNQLPLGFRALGADAKGYHELAVNIMNGKGFIDNETGQPSALRTPLYPLFLAFIYLIFGVNFFAVRIIQCAIGAFLCVIVYFIAKEMFGRKIGSICALAMVFYQPYVFYVYYGGPGFLLSENLFTLLFALTVLFLTRCLSEEKQYLRHTVLSGFFLGLTALTRPDIALFPVFLLALVFAYFKKRHQRRLALKKILCILCIFIFTILPWSLRNFIVYKKIIPLSTHGGYVFWSGNNPDSRGSFTRGVTPNAIKNAVVAGPKDEARASNLYFKEGLKFMAGNYKSIPKLFAKKFAVTWNLFNDFNKYNIWYGIVFSFALIGFYLFFSRKSDHGIGSCLLVTVFLYFSFIAVIFVGEPRYRYPAEPFLIIFAGYGVVTAGRLLRSKVLFSALICLILAVNALLYACSDKVLGLVRLLSRQSGLSW